jgi:hypothetical protein
MVGSLRTLVSGAFDYAGLFPPASLNMASAVQEYVALRASDPGILMSRFVCPIDALGDFWSEASKTSVDEWSLTVLGSGMTGLRADLETLQRFEEQTSGRANVEGYEIRASGPGDVRPELLKPLANAGFDECFVEIPWVTEQPDLLHLLAEFEVIGAKVRMGGGDRFAYPATADVATFLQECINLDLAFKLTAGLHHPIRRKHPKIDAMEHGFLNVLMAACLGLVDDLSRVEIERILADESADRFWFREDDLGWGDFDATREEVSDFRDLFAAIGSCSITEPYEDLRGLELVR